MHPDPPAPPPGPPPPGPPHQPAGPPGQPPWTAPPPPQVPHHRTWAVVGGLLLVVPAVLACLVGYAWPTVRAAWSSVHPGNEFVGLDSYQRVLDADRLGFGFSLSLAVPLLVTLLVVAPLLAWAAHRAGWPARWGVRLALVFPMVALAPAALAAAWRFDDRSVPLLKEPSERLGDPGVQASLRTIGWLATFGLVCAVGVTLFLAALRSASGPEPRRPDRDAAPGGSAPGGSVWPALLTVGGLAAIATVAVALQAFTYPFTITGGGLAASTTPMTEIITRGLIVLDVGYGNAYAVLLLVPLMVLGLGATVLVILTGLRMELHPPRPGGPSGWDGPRIVALVATVLGLVVVLAVTLYGLEPWLSRMATLGPDGLGSAELVARTWLPPLPSTLLGVGLAAVAGFGIGALRPLGRWSELLLLPFAPWLFVGVGPLVLVKFDTARSLDQLDTDLGLIPPVWLVVPALFLFTLLFRGLARQGHGYGRMLLWALPMLALALGATWLVQAQSLLWSYTVGGFDSRTAPVWAAQTAPQYAADPDLFGFGLVLPIPMIIWFGLALAVLQVCYLDRLAFRVGHRT